VEKLFDFIWVGGKFEWNWTDWLGAPLLFLVIAFVIFRLVALFQNERAITVMAQTVRALAMILRRKSN
jgi:hypothetical protein